MFFAEGEEKKLPEKLKEELNRLDIRYQLICYFDDNGENIDRKIIDYVIDSLNLSLKYYDKVGKRVRDLITGAIGNIPLTLDLDKLNLNRKIREIIAPLIDIIDAHACKDINRKKLIISILKKLVRLRRKFKGGEFKEVKIGPPLFSEKKYPKPSTFLKKKFEECKEEFYNFLRLRKEKKDLNKGAINLYTNLLELYLETKHPHFLEFMNQLPVTFAGRKIKLDDRIENIMFDQITSKEISSSKRFIYQKLKKLKRLKQKF